MNRGTTTACITFLLCPFMGACTAPATQQTSGFLSSYSYQRTVPADLLKHLMANQIIDKTVYVKVGDPSATVGIEWKSIHSGSDYYLLSSKAWVVQPAKGLQIDFRTDGEPLTLGSGQNALQQVDLSFFWINPPNGSHSDTVGGSRILTIRADGTGTVHKSSTDTTADWAQTAVTEVNPSSNNKPEEVELFPASPAPGNAASR